MIFDLVFLAVLLTVLVLLVLAAYAGLRGRGRRASSLFLVCGATVTVYFAVLLVVSLASPQRVLALGEDWCFDDWCIAVDGVTRAEELGPPGESVRANGVFYVVRLRLSNHARGRDQRAASAAVHLLDGSAYPYEVSDEGQRALEAEDGPMPPLTATIPLGQSLSTTRVFDLPRDVRDVGLTVEHPVGFSPGLFVIAGQASLLHKPTIVRLR